jgi:hypothetical protein
VLTLARLISCPPVDGTELLSPSGCFEKLRIRIDGFVQEELTIHFLRIVGIERKWTAWKSPDLPHSTHDNENDSGILEDEHQKIATLSCGWKKRPRASNR